MKEEKGEIKEKLFVFLKMIQTTFPNHFKFETPQTLFKRD
jgi:hypothetical protein